MRVVNKETFLGLPDGTVFRHFDQYDGAVGDLCIKNSSETYNLIEDYGYQVLFSQPFYDYNKEEPDLENTEFTDEDLPIDDCDTYRDGCFSKNEKFVIFSKEDTKVMIKCLECSLK